MKNFSDFNLKDDVYKFIELNGFVSPTKIQEAVIFEALKGKGIVAISDTTSPLLSFQYGKQQV